MQALAREHARQPTGEGLRMRTGSGWVYLGGGGGGGLAQPGLSGVELRGLVPVPVQPKDGAADAHRQRLGLPHPHRPALRPAHPG